MVVCVGGPVGVLMGFKWRLLGVGRGVLGGGGWVGGSGWVSEFWTSGIVYMLILNYKHEYSVLNLAKKWTEWVLEKHSSSYLSRHTASFAIDTDELGAA